MLVLNIFLSVREMKSFQVWAGWGDVISPRIDTSIMFEGWGIRLDLKYSANIIIADGERVMCPRPLPIFTCSNVPFCQDHFVPQFKDDLQHHNFAEWIVIFVCLAGAEVSGFTAVTLSSVWHHNGPALTLTTAPVTCGSLGTSSIWFGPRGGKYERGQDNNEYYLLPFNMECADQNIASCLVCF